MLHYLTQTTTDHPVLMSGQTLEHLLHPTEQTLFAGFKTAKRRHDWLLGRWTAKRLLQELITIETGIRPNLPDIVIGNRPSGAPFVQGKWAYINNGWSLSISHSGEYGFCAVVNRPNIPVGADIEKIEKRHPAFAPDYFTPAELALVEQSTQPDLQITAIWSAKEAVLKALQWGLTVDTRWLTCYVTPVSSPPTVWTPFQIEVTPPTSGQFIPPLTGWWQVYEQHILTLALGTTNFNPSTLTQPM